MAFINNQPADPAVGCSEIILMVARNIRGGSLKLESMYAWKLHNWNISSIVIPPKSNTFFDGRRTCHLS